jgi:hypothetical protein
MVGVNVGVGVGVGVVGTTPKQSVQLLYGPDNVVDEYVQLAHVLAVDITVKQFSSKYCT